MFVVEWVFQKTGFHHECKTEQFYPLFDYIYSEELKYKFGEDYSFCIRWRDIGGQVWVDPEIEMGHIGLKCFQGHFGNWLKSRIIEQT